MVVGQAARDLVVVVDTVPGPNGTARVQQRREMLGGKGANQAVGLSQLGVRVGLVAVVGHDPVGSALLRQARADRVQVSRVTRRNGARTGLVVDVVSADGRWHYLEDLPGDVLLSEADVMAAADQLAAAQAVVIQLQQPPDATLAAARCARTAGRCVILDGAPADERHRDPLLALANVVRADPREAEQLTGTRLDTVEAARRAGRDLLRRGPHLAALAVRDVGNVFAWAGGELFIPHTDVKVVDSTGAGDAFTAALTAALLRGSDPPNAARHAVAAASATVVYPGGRPQLNADRMHAHLALVTPEPG
jgi:ribokinase